MKEYPILFSDEMVRAILGGHKTQTRRPVIARNSTVLGYAVSAKNPMWSGLVWDNRVCVDPGFPDKAGNLSLQYLHVPFVHPADGDDGCVYRVRSRIEPGDRLWVQEKWGCRMGDYDAGVPLQVSYEADNSVREIDPDSVQWEKWVEKPGMICATHMPRWASRINVEVLRVWVEKTRNNWVWGYESQLWQL